MAIVDRFYNDASLSGRRWLIIADDDTILRYTTLAPNPNMVNIVSWSFSPQCLSTVQTSGLLQYLSSYSTGRGLWL